MKILARTRPCILQNCLFSSPRLILLLCSVYCNLNAISPHGEYTFMSPTLIIHVLRAQWKRISECPFFTHQRFSCLPSTVTFLEALFLLFILVLGVP